MYRTKQHTPRLTADEVESILEREIIRLIARDLSVRPEEATPEGIRKWREENLYPQAPVKTTTHYGGYNGSSLRVLTGNEIASHRERATKFLLRFA